MDARCHTGNEPKVKSRSSSAAIDPRSRAWDDDQRHQSNLEHGSRNGEAREAYDVDRAWHNIFQTRIRLQADVGAS